MSAMKNKQSSLIRLLDSHLAALNKAKASLLLSIHKCEKFMHKSDKLTEAEEESCEALTARFARAADIFTQKVLAGIILLLGENPTTFIDKAQLAEKIGVVKSANELFEIRSIRNEIAHEYREVDLLTLFHSTCDYSKKLCNLIDDANKYAEKIKKQLQTK
ncbi:MAG: hypothetical protein WCW01_01835 [Gammaproteobacteria bacterium]